MKKYFLSILMTCIFLSTYGQWECPSQLGGCLKPAGDSKFLWGTEFTVAAGYLSNNSIYNAMGLFGIDYTSNSYTFYIEGGIKYWTRTDYDLNASYHNTRFGLRELYYQNKGKIGNITIGLQSMRSSDIYLLNERVLGLNYLKSFSKLSLNIFGGTIDKDFARNGTFCNVAYLYDIFPYRNRTSLGSALGQTNMAGLTFELHPTLLQNDAMATDDGLGIMDESQTPKWIHIETVGLALYTEYGSWITSSPILGGLYSTIGVGKDFLLKPEILYQSASGNRAVIYCLKAEKTFTWSNSHRTSFEAAYFGLKSIDEGARAVNLFSNIFSGSVLRLDTPDLPFYQIAAKHTIPALKAHLKLQYNRQVIASPMQEFDAELGKKFFGKLLVNGTLGYIKSPILSSDPKLFRVEIRLDL